MIDEKKTFEDVLGGIWQEGYASREDNPTVEMAVHGLEEVIIVFPVCWDDYRPIADRMTKEEGHKLYRLFLHSNEMFKMLKQDQSSESAALVRKIEEGKPCSTWPSFG